MWRCLAIFILLIGCASEAPLPPPVLGDQILYGMVRNTPIVVRDGYHDLNLTVGQFVETLVTCSLPDRVGPNPVRIASVKQDRFSIEAELRGRTLWLFELHNEPPPENALLVTVGGIQEPDGSNPTLVEDWRDKLFTVLMVGQIC